MLLKQARVLDHGYVGLVEFWGSDERIIEAARMSTGKGFQGWGPVHSDECYQKMANYSPSVCICTPKERDEKLLRFLWKNRHHTPFEMAGMVIEVKAPIFVFREWHRHRTQSYNELSARYTPLPQEDYMPAVNVLTTRMLAARETSNRQASAGVNCAAPVSAADILAWLADLANLYTHAQRVYDAGLALGVPKELARLPIPVARYSRMRASANLRNWLAFLTLRLAPNAQWEIRQYAHAIGGLLYELFPRTYALFEGDKDA